jgi:hypothetical protein
MTDVHDFVRGLSKTIAKSLQRRNHENDK